MITKKSLFKKLSTIWRGIKAETDYRLHIYLAIHIEPYKYKE